MFRRILPLLGIILLAPLAGLTPAAPAGAASSLPAVTTLATNANAPATDGTFVVWHQFGDDTAAMGAGDIYAANLHDLQPFVLADGPADQVSPAIDPGGAGVAIWIERLGSDVAIRGARLFEDDRFTVAAWTDAGDDFPDVRASVFDRWIIWVGPGQSSGREQLWARNVDTMDPPVLLREVTGRIAPAVNEDMVAWLEHDREAQAVNLWAWEAASPENQPNLLETSALVDDAIPALLAPGVNRYRLVWREATVATGADGLRLLASPLDAWQPVAIAPDAGAFDLDGATVAYEAADRIMAYDLNGNRARDLGAGFAPVAEGRLVFYETALVRPEIGRYPFLVLAGYDLWTDSRFVVAEFGPTGAPFSYQVAAREPGIAWTLLDETTGLRLETVQAADFDEILPSAPRLAPPEPDPARAFFPETGHYLQAGFKTFWERSGELPVFGYPLTEEFEQLSIDTGAFHTVQYFERQRFEWHPANAGTPYEVLLGRLGAERAASLGIAGWEPFQPRGADESPGVGCSYFAETGHFICPPFDVYWENHGLEFGDPGISFRESLALFGYPISELMTETNADGDTVLTQFFERAVFEWHPDNPPEHQVLLRRLGAEELTSRGW